MEITINSSTAVVETIRVIMITSFPL